MLSNTISNLHLEHHILSLIFLSFPQRLQILLNKKDQLCNSQHKTFLTTPQVQNILKTRLVDGKT